MTVKNFEPGIHPLAYYISVADRPKCLYCGKPLRPNVHHLEWPPEEKPPEVGEEVMGAAHNLITCHGTTRRYSKYGQPFITVWDGTYCGYGYLRKALRPAFCSNPCGVQFGAALAEAGYRIKGRET